DPENHFQELDETNNTARVRVTIPGRATLDPDPYEPNASTNDIDGRPQGGPNSPNLGPCNPKRTIEELTIHEGGDVDFFKFYNPGNGGAIDMVRIDFQHSSGDLGLQLLGSNGTLLASSRTSANFEIISLTDRPAGWYYARVFGESSTVTQDSYTLTINPGLSDNPPTIESLAPAEGDLRLPHGIGIYTVRWNSSDEDGDPVWVSVYVNSVPERDGNEELLPTSLHGDGSLGFYIVNSADFAPGTYWFYFRATDGGSVTGAWSEGTVTFIDVEPECTNVGNGGDCDGNGILDSCDLESGIRDDCNGNAIPDVCDIESGLLSDVNRDGKPDNCGIPFHRGDTNVDASIDVSDAVVVLSYLFRGRPVACLESADVDNSGQVNLTDAIGLLNYLFRLGAPPVSPGVPKSGICGRDSDLSGSEGDLGCETYDVCL
ncbi:MAG: pre-peptidase C-terminal domain-containing protein, partial [Planctomycetota bacterium]